MEPDARVIRFIHELEFGLRLLPVGGRRQRLRAVLSKFVTEYQDRFLALERREAEQAAALRAHAQRSGRTVHLGNALIAGTAKAHDLAVATRNVLDFDDLDVEIINPLAEVRGMPQRNLGDKRPRSVLYGHRGRATSMIERSLGLGDGA